MATVIHTVTYDVDASNLSLFRASITQHAETTRQREPGCTRFDISYGADIQTLCLTYTVFASADALDYHLASDHYHVFQELSREWVISRVEQFWELGASPRRGAGPATAV